MDRSYPARKYIWKCIAVVQCSHVWHWSGECKADCECFSGPARRIQFVERSRKGIDCRSGRNRRPFGCRKREQFGDSWRDPRQRRPTGSRHQPTRSGQPSADPAQQTEMATMQRINQALLIEFAHSKKPIRCSRRKRCSSWSVRKSSRTISSPYSSGKRLQRRVQHRHSATDKCRNPVGFPLLMKQEAFMDFLILIKDGCDKLTATVGPSVDALGLHMVFRSRRSCWSGLVSRKPWPPLKAVRDSISRRFLTFSPNHFRLLFRKVLQHLNSRDRIFPKGIRQRWDKQLVDYIGRDSLKKSRTLFAGTRKIGTCPLH